MAPRLDLAGTGKADIGSLQFALQTALTMTNTINKMTHIPRKRFGQNFLHDHNIIYNIISSIQAKADEHWVEIGPGQGALTEPLLNEKVRLDVVELDRDLVVLLKDKFKPTPQFANSQRRCVTI